MTALKLSQSLLRLKFDSAESERLGLLSPSRQGLAGPEFRQTDESAMSAEEKMAARRARSKARRDWFDKIIARRFVEYAVQDEVTQAQMLIEDLGAELKE